jgi:hypothetical protein
VKNMQSDNNVTTAPLQRMEIGHVDSDSSRNDDVLEYVNRLYDFCRKNAATTAAVLILKMLLVALIVGALSSSSSSLRGDKDSHQAGYAMETNSESSSGRKAFLFEDLQGEILSEETPLLTEIKSKYMDAYQSGAMVPLTVMNTEAVTAGRIPFIVSRVGDEMTVKKNVTQAAAGKLIDPFDAHSIDERLVVANIEPDFTLLLNKFGSMRQHSLLVTQYWEEQRVAVSAEQLTAWFWCLRQTDGIGFYNSGLHAGASQPHKHLQFVPRRSLSAAGPISDVDKQIPPIERSIQPHMRSREWIPFDPTQLGEQSNIYKVDEFALFQHGLAILLTPEDWRRDHYHRAGETHIWSYGGMFHFDLVH